MSLFKRLVCLLSLVVPACFAANCSCDLRVTTPPFSQQIQSVVESGYYGWGADNACRNRCLEVWNNLSSTTLIEWAQSKGICGRVLFVEMKSGVPQPRTVVGSAGIQIPPCSGGNGQQERWFQYAAKFACGAIAQPSDPKQLLAPGRYFTTINVHNPHDATVTIRKRFSFGLGFETMGPLSEGFKTAIESGRTIDIQCADIMDHSGNPAANTGFAVIESPSDLNVVSLYSAGPIEGQVSSVHLDRVPARTMTAPTITFCPDGTTGLDASTGAGTWSVTPPGLGSQTTTAQVQLTKDPGWGTLNGAQWIGIGTQPGILPGGDFEFRSCFCRCEKSPTSIQLQGLGDNQLTVLLNQNPVYSFSGFSGTPPQEVINNPTLFSSGRNCLVARVRNQPQSPMGLLLKAIVSGASPTNASGECPK